MPSTKITLAWAIRVPVEQLGAHLEAYVKLRPAIDTIRLCNRFGKGEKATITKMPVEMIQEIESYLMEEERTTQLEAWRKDLRCWEGSCKPIDHFSDARALEVYNEIRQEMAEWDGYESPNGSDGTDYCCEEFWDKCYMSPVECPKGVKRWLQNHLHGRTIDCDGFEDRMPYHRDEHDQRVESWFARVGRPTDESRGKFSTFSEILRKHFGLQAWISHSTSYTANQDAQDMPTGSTLAYLCLPRTFSTEHSWRKNVDNTYDGPQRVRTEIGWASAVTGPRKPSKKALSRFDRVLRILACKAIVDVDEESDEESGDESESGEEQGGDEEEESVQPELKVFMRNNDAEESYW